MASFFLSLSTFIWKMGRIANRQETETIRMLGVQWKHLLGRLYIFIYDFSAPWWPVLG